MKSAACGKRGVLKTRSAETAEYEKHGVWNVKSVENFVLILFVYRDFQGGTAC